MKIISLLSKFYWKTEELSYHCVSCRTNTDGSFKYDKGLQRLLLDASTSFESLSDGVCRELLFIRSVKLKSDVLTSFEHNAQDQVSNAIISAYYSTSKQHFAVLETAIVCSIHFQFVSKAMNLEVLN
jgi:hypothetical protein